MCSVFMGHFKVAFLFTRTVEGSSTCVMFSWDSLILPLVEVSSACIMFSWNSLICSYPLVEVSSTYIWCFYGTV